MFTEKISQYIWEIKYRYSYQDKIIDRSIADTWQRIAEAVAMAEAKKNQAVMAKKFYQILENFKFLPGGRIIAGAGTRKKVTLFNCFVMPIKKDSLPAIFNALAEGAFTLQQGGGIGIDFSILRPKGSKNKQSQSVASGPISFMRIWDSMAATMESTGSRRGAMMANLRCDHPDIEEFITAKEDPRELRQFNVSVIVTDEFMTAVANNENWPLVFPIQGKIQKGLPVIYRRWSGSTQPVACQLHRSVNARELWHKIISSAYQYAEPGVIFEDTINRFNPLYNLEWLSATNPCGEIPLPPYGACNLGAINLTQFIVHPFTPKASINWAELENVTEIATCFLDNVIDISQFPLRAQQQSAQRTRRIGLGFTGLADALVMLGIRYGSEESILISQQLMAKIAEVTWHTSARLARQKSSFPLFNKKKYLASEFIDQLPFNVRHWIQRYGMRNSHHNAIAPAGTISLLANNISNGLEPIFSTQYQRKVRLPDGNIETFSVMNYSYRQWTVNHNQGLPKNWATVSDITPSAHIQIQSAIQKYVDNAISKTINLPVNFPFEKLADIYSMAHASGLKGCTIFRPNAITGNVIEIDDVDRCCQI